MDELTREFLIGIQEGLDRMERCLTELETRLPSPCNGGSGACRDVAVR